MFYSRSHSHCIGASSVGQYSWGLGCCDFSRAQHLRVGDKPSSTHTVWRQGIDCPARYHAHHPASVDHQHILPRKRRSCGNGHVKRHFSVKCECDSFPIQSFSTSPPCCYFEYFSSTPGYPHLKIPSSKARLQIISTFILLFRYLDYTRSSS